MTAAARAEEAPLLGVPCTSFFYLPVALSASGDLNAGHQAAPSLAQVFPLWFLLLPYHSFLPCTPFHPPSLLK